MALEFIEELPAYVYNCLDDYDKAAWMRRYNQELLETKDPDLAYMTAWAWVADSPNIRRVSGWISVEQVDSKGDVVDIDGLMEAMPLFIINGGGVFFHHKSLCIGTCYNFQRGEVDGKPAVWADAAIYQDFAGRAYTSMWERIQEGQLHSFSVAGDKLREFRQCKDGMCYNNIAKTHLFDLTLTFDPVNLGATVEEVNMMAKAYQDELRTFMTKARTPDEVLTNCKVCKGLYDGLVERGMPDADAKTAVHGYAKSFAPKDCGCKADPKLMQKDDTATEQLLNRVLAIVLEMRSEMAVIKAQKAVTEGAEGVSPMDQPKAAPGTPEDVGGALPEEKAQGPAPDAPQEGGEAPQGPAPTDAPPVPPEAPAGIPEEQPAGEDKGEPESEEEEKEKMTEKANTAPAPAGNPEIEAQRQRMEKAGQQSSTAPRPSANDQGVQGQDPLAQKYAPGNHKARMGLKAADIEADFPRY